MKMGSLLAEKCLLGTQIWWNRGCFKNVSCFRPLFLSSFNYQHPLELTSVWGISVWGISWAVESKSVEEKRKERCWLLVALLPVFARALVVMLCSGNFRLVSFSFYCLLFSPTFHSFVSNLLHNDGFVRFSVKGSWWVLWRRYELPAASDDQSFRDMRDWFCTFWKKFLFGVFSLSVSLVLLCPKFLCFSSWAGWEVVVRCIYVCNSPQFLWVQQIWNDIGESEADKDRMLLELEMECLEVYRRKVEEAANAKARLHQSVALKEAEVATLMAALGELSSPVKIFVPHSLEPI